MSDAKLDGQRDLSKPHEFKGQFENRRCIHCRVQAHDSGSFKDCPGPCGCDDSTVCDKHAPELKTKLEKFFIDSNSEWSVKPNGTAVFGVSETMVPSVSEGKRVQLVVTHQNENVTFHPVGDEKPWKIDAGLQLLVIGKGVDRVMVPLCNVMYFTLQEY